MTKTTIKLTADNEATLTAVDPLGWDDEPVTWVFWIPINGGYVRLGANHMGDDPQVCRALKRTGETLTARDGAALLATIRREWQARRRAEVLE